jgi:hypothetical protein
MRGSQDFRNSGKSGLHLDEVGASALSPQLARPGKSQIEHMMLEAGV